MTIDKYAPVFCIDLEHDQASGYGIVHARGLRLKMLKGRLWAIKSTVFCKVDKWTHRGHHDEPDTGLRFLKGIPGWEKHIR